MGLGVKKRMEPMVTAGGSVVKPEIESRLQARDHFLHLYPYDRIWLHHRHEVINS